MNSTTAVLVAGAVIVIVVVALLVRSRRANDGVDSFKRQIEALSPEARRPVVDQVQNAAERQGVNDEPDLDDDDEDPVRGT